IGTMSASLSTTGISLSRNSTTDQGAKTRAAIYAFLGTPGRIGMTTRSWCKKLVVLVCGAVAAIIDVQLANWNKQELTTIRGNILATLQVLAWSDVGLIFSRLEFRVFNMVILSLAVCVLVVAAVVCCISYNSRRRWSVFRYVGIVPLGIQYWRRNRTRVNESNVDQPSGAELVDAKATRKRRSFRNTLALLWRQEPSRDNSRIYYIYSNPLPVGRPEDEPSTSQTPTTHTPLTLQDYANDPKSGIVLDPPTFYMQL
ncbi:hypothetical protein NFI96_019581, partial [Prochilodus magdalenae]